MHEPVRYVTFQGKTLFIPFRYVYPECLELLAPHSQVHPLHCLRKDFCPGNKNCMGTLTHRLNYLFTTVDPEVELIVAYFKWRDTASIRAGVFHRDMRVPRVMTVNPTALKKFLDEGDVKRWVPKTDYWLPTGGPAIIPAEALSRVIRGKQE